MKNLIKLLFFYLFILLNISCAQNNNSVEIIENSETVEYLYKLAIIDLDNKKYDEAQAKFEEI